MSIRNLDRLLTPHSVVVVGASARSGSVGATLWQNLRGGGFKGPVYAVNPKHRELNGEPVFARIADLPAVADLAVVCTPPRKFMSAARAAARNKPVIVVKAGRAGRGVDATTSHSGALASADIVFDAAIRRAGMLRVDTLQDLFMAAQTLARFRGNRGEVLTILSNGGGAGAVAADAAARAGVALWNPDAALLQRLDTVLPAGWSRGNPIEIVGGSVFWIELDTSAAPQLGTESGQVKAAVAQGSLAQPGVQVYTLLCVEDNPANLMLIEKLVARRPEIRLLSARDGTLGIEIARASQPDVILMDINLPGISGIQALKILAADPATAWIPVIALSANAMPRDIEKGLEAGFFRYLTKPIRVNELMDTLDIAFKLATTRSPRASTEVDT